MFQTAFVAYRSFAAIVETVHADDATRIIDAVRLGIDARGLATAGAERAAGALARVYHRAHQGVARQQAEHRPNGADGVAVRASVAPRQHDEHHHRRDGHEQRGQALEPDVGLIESVAVHPFGQVGQHIVAPGPQRSQQRRRDAPVGAVGSQQGGQRTDAGHQSRHKEDQHGVAQPRQSRGVAKAAFLAATATAEPRHDVLENAQRADNGTIHAAKEQRKHDEGYHNLYVERQHGRQKLDAGQPAEPRVHRSREVEEEQRDECQREDRQGQSDFS